MTLTREQGQERDEEILHLVSQLGYLRVDQIARLTCGGRQRVARRRLLRLTQQGRLSRFAPGRNQQYVYCLPGRRRDGVTAAHPLAVADIYCALVATCPDCATIETFQPEYRAGVGYRADALMVATIANRRVAVAWEIDLATEHLPTVVRKVDALALYHASGEYRQAAWWQSGIEVLQVFVTPTKRAAQLRLAVATAAAKAGVPAVVLDSISAGVEPWTALQQPLTAAQPQPTAPSNASLACGSGQGNRRYTPAWKRPAHPSQGK